MNIFLIFVSIKSKEFTWQIRGHRSVLKSYKLLHSFRIENCRRSPAHTVPVSWIQKGLEAGALSSTYMRLSLWSKAIQLLSTDIRVQKVTTVQYLILGATLYKEQVQLWNQAAWEHFIPNFKSQILMMMGLLQVNQSGLGNIFKFFSNSLWSNAIR